MKKLLLASAILSTCVTAHSTTTVTANDTLSEGTKIIAKRLASRNLTEVVVIAMKLQIECQEFNETEVCEGVRNILTVLDARVASLPNPSEDPSVAFVMGLMEGVNDANRETIGNIK